MNNRYVFVFNYGRDWMIICYKDGNDDKYFNSAENDWDDSLDYAEMLIENGGNMYYYELPSYDLIKSIDIFSLKNEPIEGLKEFLK